MQRPNDLSRSLVNLEQDATLIAVIEMGQSSWLVAGIVPGIERQPLKKLTTDQQGLLQLLHRWRKEATQAGRTIKRISVGFEAGRDGFWLARWLRAHEIEAYVIHPLTAQRRDGSDFGHGNNKAAKTGAGRKLGSVIAAWMRSPSLPRQ
jgi:transposase